MVEWWDTLQGFESAARVQLWIKGNDIGTLNIAGPRESKYPGIYAASVEFLRQVLTDLRLASVQ